MNNNGHGLPGAIAGGKIIGPPPVKFDWTEQVYRMIAGNVVLDVAKNGGGIPMPDPGGFIVGLLVLDRLAKIEERLAKLERPASVVGIQLPQDAT